MAMYICSLTKRSHVLLLLYFSSKLNYSGNAIKLRKIIKKKLVKL